MLDDLKTLVCEANLKLVSYGLVFQTWGNVSGIDRQKGLVVIKPSGVAYETMQSHHMAVVSLDDGRLVEGELAPSCDTPTHLVLYRAMPNIGGIAHTHSLWATAWAQARQSIAPYGTTHADHFHGEIPCTRPLRQEETDGDYEVNTGRVILETLAGRDALHTPGVLVAEHGPFAWGQTPAKAVDSAAVIEQIAMLAGQTLRINADASPISRWLMDRHFHRKHGPNAYYGQPPKQK